MFDLVGVCLWGWRVGFFVLACLIFWFLIDLILGLEVCCCLLVYCFNLVVCLIIVSFVVLLLALVWVGLVFVLAGASWLVDFVCLRFIGGFDCIAVCCLAYWFAVWF